MLESKIEFEVCKYARSRGVLAYKFTSPGKRGVPDRIFLYRQRVMFIEFKRADKTRLDPLQLVQQRLIEEQGIEVYPVNDIAGGCQIILDFIRSCHADTERPASLPRESDTAHHRPPGVDAVAINGPGEDYHHAERDSALDSVPNTKDFGCGSTEGLPDGMGPGS
jgi:hypothetical protein